MALQPKWDARPPPPARRTTFPKVITIPYGKFLPRVKTGVVVLQAHQNVSNINFFLFSATVTHTSELDPGLFTTSVGLKWAVLCVQRRLTSVEKNGQGHLGNPTFILPDQILMSRLKLWLVQRRRPVKT